MVEDKSKAARAYFPRGLHQPAGSFRSSAEAPLLASFAAGSLPALAGKNFTALDLGCGAGTAGLGLLIQRPDLRLLGVDCQSELVQAARLNAELLSLAGAFQALRLEAAEIAAGKGAALAGDFLCAEACRLVLCNPPYRDPMRGRLPPGNLRRRALFADSRELEAFARAISFVLHPEGAFCLAFSPQRLPEMEDALRRSGLWLWRALPVRGHTASPIKFLLLEGGKKNPGPAGARQLAPLALYAAPPADGRPARLSAQARKFCPCLGRNSASDNPTGNDLIAK